MKKLALLFITLLLSATAYGQISVGGNLNLGLPQGDFGDAYKTGFGFTATGRYGVTERLNVGLNLGALYYNGEDNTILGDELSARFVPITGLVEFKLLTGKFSPYLGLDLGFYNIRVEAGPFDDSETKLGLAPTAGLNYGLTDNLDLNFNLKYHYVATDDESTTFLGIGAGVIFYIGDKR